MTTAGKPDENTTLKSPLSEWIRRGDSWDFRAGVCRILIRRRRSPPNVLASSLHTGTHLHGAFEDVSSVWPKARLTKGTSLDPTGGSIRGDRQALRQSRFLCWKEAEGRGEFLKNTSHRTLADCTS